MKKLYSFFTTLSFTLLVSIGATQAMETGIIHPAVVNQVPSLKNICLNYICENATLIKDAEQKNLIDQLPELPNELGVEILESANDTYIKKNRNRLIKLAKSNKLDSNVSCVIANRFFDMKLAYKLAEQSAITNETAAFIIYNFMEKIEDKCCSSNFDTIFNKSFPEKILAHGNYERLYYHLLQEITADTIYDFYSTIDNETLFSAKDFDQNFSLKEIINFLTHKKFENEDLYIAYKNNLITLSPCKNFLAFFDDNQRMQLIHIKTHNSIEIDVTFEDEGLVNPVKLVFNQDCSKLGILSTDNTIYTITVPTILLKNELSLSNLAALAYCKEHLYKQIPIDNDDQEIAIEHILFQDNQEAHKLGTFITKHRIIESFLQDFSFELLCIHEHTINWSLVFHKVAAAFSMTEKEVAIKMAQDDQFIYDIIKYVADKQNRELFEATLSDKEAMHFFYDMIVPILNNNQINQ